MDVKEVLLHKLIEHLTRRHAEAALGLEVVDVLRENICQVADVQKGVVRVNYIGAWLR
jgi:hypothetical protein